MMRKQCSFVETRYAIDPDDFEIYHNFNCTKPEGHTGRHSFYKNPTKFFKDWRSARHHQQKMLHKMELKVKEAEVKINQNKL